MEYVAAMDRLRRFARQAISFAFALQVPLGPCFAADEWEDLSESLFKALPEYEPVERKLYTGVGAIVVLPVGGEVFAIMNRDYGVLRSLDAGETWERLPQAPLRGRAYGGFSACLDARTGRFAVFMQEANRFGIKAVGGLTLDKGESWTPIGRPDHPARHDGYTWGGVDWTARLPEVILGKEHHAWVALWLSRDAGATWSRLPFESRNAGVLGPQTYVAGVDAFAQRGEMKAEPGIYRSGDSGQNWQKVSPVVVSGKTPVSWGDSHYWTCKEGVLICRDDGRSWGLLGSPLPDSLYGPIFGRSEREMMVVARSGIHVSRNGGESWNHVADAIEGAYNVGNPLTSFGWHPEAGLLYYAAVGGGLYRLRIP